MYVVHAPKRDENVLSISVNQWEVGTGHRKFAAKAGPHKDKRRKSKASERVKFRKELDY